MAYGIPFNDKSSLIAAKDKIRSSQTGPVAFRVEACRYSYVIDADREEYGLTDRKLELSVFEVLALTPKGFWVKNHGWIPHDETKKQWASLTATEALNQFARRRSNQIQLLKGQLSQAEDESRLAWVVMSHRVEGTSFLELHI